VKSSNAFLGDSSEKEIVLSSSDSSDSGSSDSDSDSDPDSDSDSDSTSSSEDEGDLKPPKKTLKKEKRNRPLSAKVTSASRRLDLDQKSVETPKKDSSQSMIVISNHNVKQKLEGRDTPKTPSPGSLKAMQESENEIACRGFSSRWLHMEPPTKETVVKMLMLFPQLNAEFIAEMLPDRTQLKAPTRGRWMYNLYLNLGLPQDKRLERDDKQFLNFSHFYTHLTGFERAEIVADMNDFRKYHGKLL
jgi:hypothetical protein